MFYLTFICRSFGQQVAPSVQQKIDSLQTWIQQEINLYGKVDTAALRCGTRRSGKEQDRVKSHHDDPVASFGGARTPGYLHVQDIWALLSLFGRKNVEAQEGYCKQGIRGI